MERFAPYDFDYSINAGDQLTRFPLGEYHFGVLICYEDTYTDLAREYVYPNGREVPVDFLLSISNDGWFDGTSEHDEHLAMCRFRAIESRRAVARAVNMGISAIVDSSGRVLHVTQVNSGRGQLGEVWRVDDRSGASWPTDEWHRLKKVAAVLEGQLPLDRRSSVYARFGEWLPALCGVITSLGIVWSYVPWWRRLLPEIA
jgi:apolipoprotein N-acyltransferase